MMKKTSSIKEFRSCSGLGIDVSKAEVVAPEEQITH